MNGNVWYLDCPQTVYHGIQFIEDKNIGTWRTCVINQKISASHSKIARFKSQITTQSSSVVMADAALARADDVPTFCESSCCDPTLDALAECVNAAEVLLRPT